jgi:outer membrane protein OmpA-like peptidoglycan-associated protein
VSEGPFRPRGARCGWLALLLWATAGLMPGAAAAQETAPGKAASPAEGPARKLPALEVRVDLDEVDLAAGRLTLRMSRPAARVTLKALGISGAVLVDVEQSFEAAPAGSPLVVMWSPPEGEQVARIEVFGYDTSDYYKGVAITPWSFEIPHEDVVFETDSAEIRPSEVGKLQASLVLIKKQLPRAKHLGTVTLFVVAHTDTVATEAYNQELSARRAQSLARWFRSHGLQLPIAYAGMGERALKVKTEDNVDEARNRRADYMLGVEAPRFKSSGFMPAWKKL